MIETAVGIAVRKHFDDVGHLTFATPAAITLNDRRQRHDRKTVQDYPMNRGTVT